MHKLNDSLSTCGLRKMCPVLTQALHHTDYED